jgi:hypothetical protein
VPTTIPTDCSRDVTAELQAVIDATPDESTIEFPAGACYQVDGTLEVVQRHGLTIHGNGATFRAMTDGTEFVRPKRVRTRNMWTFGGDDRISVDHVVVRGANPHAGLDERGYRAAFEAQHAYLVQNTTTMLMDHVEAYDVYGDFVAVGPGTDGLTVQNSTFARNGRQGWSITGSNIVFQHNSISDTRRATIDMEPSLPSWSAHHITIRDNEVGPGRLLFFASGGASNSTMDDINIIDNHLRRPLQIWVSSWGVTRTHYRIIGNVSDSRGVSGWGGVIALRNVSDVLVQNNFQRTQYSHRIFDVGASNVAHLVITGNVFPNAKGVWIDRGGNVDVRQWNNQIGTPLQTPAPSRTAGPTPRPA